MANTDLTIDKILNQALSIFKNTLGFVTVVDRQYDDQFAKDGGKIGDTLRIRLPIRMTSTVGRAMGSQDYTEQSVSLQVATQRHVPLNFSTAALTLSMDNFSDRYLQPAIEQLISDVDVDISEAAYQQSYNSVGTPGTTPATTAVLGDAGAMLTNYSCPPRDRFGALSPTTTASLNNVMTTLYNAQGAISDQFVNGQLAHSFGFDWISTPSILSHTCGDATGASMAATSVAGATTLSISGIDGASGSDVVKKGDVLYVAAVNGVNPVTRKSTGALQRFVVTADATASSGAISALAIAPTLYASGALQTVDALPQSGAHVTFVGTNATAYPQNILGAKKAIALATADLELPGVSKMEGRKNMDGVSIRFIRDYSISSDMCPTRLDVLYGLKVTRPEWLVRLWG